MALTRRQQIFAHEYLVDLNATRAAIRAGYSVEAAYNQGHRMMRNDEVSEFIDNAIAERLERLGITADRVIEEWAAIGFASMGDFLTADEYGCPTWDFEKASRAKSAAIRDISINTSGGGRRISIKLADKPAALMMLGKYLERAMAVRRPEPLPAPDETLSPDETSAPEETPASEETGTDSTGKVRFEIRQVEIIGPVEPRADVPQIANCQVEIGDLESPGSDIFSATACNARWADEHPDESALTDGTMLVVPSIDEETIAKEVEERFLNRGYDSLDELADRAAPLLQRESAEPEALSGPEPVPIT